MYRLGGGSWLIPLHTVKAVFQYSAVIGWLCSVGILQYEAPGSLARLSRTSIVALLTTIYYTELIHKFIVISLIYTLNECCLAFNNLHNITGVEQVLSYCMNAWCTLVVLRSAASALYCLVVKL